MPIAEETQLHRYTVYTQLLWWRQSFGSLFCGSSKGRYCWIWLTDQGLAGQMCLIRNGGIRKLCVCMTVRLKSQCGQPRLSSQKQKMSVLLKVWKEWAQQTITPRVSVSRNVRVLKWVTVSPFLMATGGNKFPCWKVHLKPAGRWFYMLCSFNGFTVKHFSQTFLVCGLFLKAKVLATHNIQLKYTFQDLLYNWQVMFLKIITPVIINCNVS